MIMNVLYPQLHVVQVRIDTMPLFTYTGKLSVT
jgi:hypothetical protein